MDGAMRRAENRLSWQKYATLMTNVANNRLSVPIDAAVLTICATKNALIAKLMQACMMLESALSITKF